MPENSEAARLGKIETPAGIDDRANDERLPDPRARISRMIAEKLHPGQCAARAVLLKVSARSEPVVIVAARPNVFRTGEDSFTHRPVAAVVGHDESREIHPRYRSVS